MEVLYDYEELDTILRSALCSAHFTTAIQLPQVIAILLSFPRDFGPKRIGRRELWRVPPSIMRMPRSLDRRSFKGE
jgi:hypothetical protein